MLVVIVNYGQIVKKFHSSANAKSYFEGLVVKHHHVWLVSENTALQMGFI